MKLPVRNFIQNQLLTTEYIELNFSELSSREVLIRIQRGVVFGVHVVRFEKVAKRLVWDLGELTVDDVRGFLVFLEIITDEMNPLSEAGEGLSVRGSGLFFQNVE